MLDLGFETVHTMTDFYDGPRRGIADFNGQPHLYVSEWDATLEDFPLEYLLSPVSQDVYLLALEDWAIWERWESAFHRGQTTIEMHPALSEDQARHRELKQILEKPLVLDRKNLVTAIGEFQKRNTSNWDGLGPLQSQVHWALAKPR